MSHPHEALLVRYLALPDQLAEAIKGLNESQLDLQAGDDWSIRAYVHHIVEGELMWQLYLRAILGREGKEIPLVWYFDLDQKEWARRWAYSKRAVEPSLALFRASTAVLAEMLRNLTVEDWELWGLVTWPGETQAKRVSVRGIILMHLRHLGGHCKDIQNIRAGTKV